MSAISAQFNSFGSAKSAVNFYWQPHNDGSSPSSVFEIRSPIPHHHLYTIMPRKWTQSKPLPER